MKKRIKDITIGILIGCILMTTTPVLADSIVQQINVIFNGIEVQVNGEKLDSPTILYNGTTYLPMRTITEAVGKEIDWNADTKTANIVEKNNNITEIENENNNNKDNNMEEKFDIYYENGNTFGKKNGEIYYSPRYILELINNYTICFLDINKYENEKIIRYYYENNETIIESVPYHSQDGSLFISKSYYENTILPLIEK